jgi:hypothetical protein
MDSHYFWKLDPDPHYSKKLGPNTKLLMLKMEVWRA